jgi:hypothetical protein
MRSLLFLLRGTRREGEGFVVDVDCDACCRQQVGADRRRARGSGAEAADWVADAGAQRYLFAVLF